MSLPPANQSSTAISPIRNFTIGPDEDFSIPRTSVPMSQYSPWVLSVPTEHCINREKSKTPEPESNHKLTLSLPNTNQSGMPRRASCPNFAIPEFNFVAQENNTMLSRRPSVQDFIPSKYFNQFNPAVSKLKPIQPPSPILEDPEMAKFEGKQNVVNGLDSNKTVKVTEMQTVEKKHGFFSSPVSSLFSANQSDKLNSSLVQNSQTDGFSPAPVKPKSYLMRRASAMSNADMNAMAPTSM